MFRLTKVEPTKQGRFALFFNGEFDFSVDAETYAVLGLSVGMEVDEETYEEIRFETEYRKAKDKAFQLLSYKSYSRRMLCDRLKKDYEESAVEQVMERLEELSLLDDMDYARRCAHDLIQLKKFSLYRVRQELRQRGVDDCTIEEVLSELEEEDDPQHRIEEIIQKKYRNSLSDEKGRRRTVNGLMRLGYSYSQIKTAIAQFSGQWLED